MNTMYAEGIKACHYDGAIHFDLACRDCLLNVAVYTGIHLDRYVWGLDMFITRDGKDGNYIRLFPLPSIAAAYDMCL